MAYHLYEVYVTLVSNMLTHDRPERHVSCLSGHYFANGLKILWFSDGYVSDKCHLSGYSCEGEGVNKGVNEIKLYSSISTS